VCATSITNECRVIWAAQTQDLYGRQSTAALLFALFFNAAPRPTMFVWYLAARGSQNYPEYDFGAVETVELISLWMLPQMHVLLLNLRFTAATKPLVALVKVRERPASQPAPGAIMRDR
jgi:hypothetical protein